MRATSWGSLSISLGGRRAQSLQQLPGDLTAGQCVLVSCHFSKSILSSFPCSLSTGPFQG